LQVLFDHLVGTGEPTDNRICRRVDAMRVNIKMRDGAQPGLVFDANSNALLGESFREALRASPGLGNIDEDEIGLDWIWQLDSFDLLQASGKPARVVVILRKSPGMIIKRVKAGRRQYSGLAHRAPEAKFPASRGSDEILATGKDGSDRASKPFREVKP
jgi:hypothetical protein